MQKIFSILFVGVMVVSLMMIPAAPVGAKAVGTLSELWFIVRFEDHPHHLLDELVAPVGDGEWSLRAVVFGDVSTATGLPTI